MIENITNEFVVVVGGTPTDHSYDLYIDALAKAQEVKQEQPTEEVIIVGQYTAWECGSPETVNMVDLVTL